jgi:hypothetical protein
MTQTDSVVSSRPQTAAATTSDPELRGDRRAVAGGRGRVARRALLAAPAVLALALPTGALAQTSSTGTSGYNQKPPVKTTTEPKSGTAPSKEATTPKSSPEPEKEAATPTTTEPTTTTAKAATSPAESKLPFTGLDLRWVLAGGLLLLAMGFSIRVGQRRRTGS